MDWDEIPAGSAHAALIDSRNQIPGDLLEKLKPGANVALKGTFNAPVEMALASARLEDLGLEVRDCACVLGNAGMSGFLLARAPLEGTVAANVLKHATGALNIDACRVGMSDEDAEFIRKTARPNSSGDVHVGSVMNRPAKVSGANVHDGGRWPANLLLEHAEKCAKTGDAACEEGCPAQTLDRQSGSSFSAGGRIGKKTDGIVAGAPAGEYEKGDPGFGDGGGASRYFRSDSSPEARLNYVLRLIIRENGVLLDLTGEAEPGWCDVWRAALQSSADSPATPE